MTLSAVHTLSFSRTFDTCHGGLCSALSKVLCVSVNGSVMYAVHSLERGHKIHKEHKVKTEYNFI